MDNKKLCKLVIFILLMNLSVTIYAGSEPPASYLNASELLELYSSMYTSINNMSVSYTDVLEKVIPDPNAPDKMNHLIRYQKVERIEEGDKYYTRYSYPKDPNGFEQHDKIADENAFNGLVSMAYCPREKSGSIVPGRTRTMYENMNDLLNYMMINNVKFSENVIKPRIRLSVDPNGKVRPHLEQISGQWCHVVDSIYPRLPGEPKSGGTTIWFAADKGGLPMKFEERDGHGKCKNSIVVEKVATVDDQVSSIWYPQEAVMTTSMVWGTQEKRFVCHELRVNIETNDDTWKISFPTGTCVVDRVSSLSYVAGPAENEKGKSK